MRFEHKKFGAVEFIELKQRHVEEFLTTMQDVDKSVPLQVYNAKALRAAADAGWFIEPKVKDIGEMSPALVRWLADRVSEVYSDAVNIDPE